MLTRPSCFLPLLPPRSFLPFNHIFSVLTVVSFRSDYECFTLLAQHGSVQALQVLNAAGEWVLAPPRKGTFIVNLGDMMQRITSASSRLSALSSPSHAESPLSQTERSKAPSTARSTAPARDG